MNELLLNREDVAVSIRRAGVMLLFALPPEVRIDLLKKYLPQGVDAQDVERELFEHGQ